MGSEKQWQAVGFERTLAAPNYKVPNYRLQYSAHDDNQREWNLRRS